MRASVLSIRDKYQLIAALRPVTLPRNYIQMALQFLPVPHLDLLSHLDQVFTSISRVLDLAKRVGMSRIEAGGAGLSNVQ